MNFLYFPWQGSYQVAKWNGTKVSVKILDRDSYLQPDSMYHLTIIFLIFFFVCSLFRTSSSHYPFDTHLEQETCMLPHYQSIIHVLSGLSKVCCTLFQTEIMFDILFIYLFLCWTSGLGSKSMSLP